MHTPNLSTSSNLAAVSLRIFQVLLIGFACVTFSNPLAATTVAPPEFPQLVNESDYIVRAVVKSVVPELKVMSTGRKLPFSKVELEVKEVIAGKPPTPLVLEVLGGSSGGRELAITGAPKFTVGDESIFFVQGNGRQVYPLVRIAHGLYPIAKDAASGREYVARSDGAPLHAVSEVSRPIHVTDGKVAASAPAAGQAVSQPLSPAEFIQQIRSNVTEARLLEK